MKNLPRYIKIRRDGVLKDAPVSSGVALVRSRAADMLTLKRMKYFLAVADTKQVTAAAHQINISPAAITAAIHHLENFLDVSLFERRHDGMYPTRNGMRFQRYCEKMLNLAEDAANLRGGDKSSVSGHLSLAASPAVHGYFLPPLLARFCRMFRGITVSLSEAKRDKIENDLISGKLDAGFVLTSNVRRRKALTILNISSSERTLWCDAHHRFAAMEAVPVCEVAREPYIQLTIDEAEENTKMFFARHAARRRCLLRTETVEAARSYVAQGMGVTILSTMLFRPWSLEGDRVLSKPIVEAIPHMDIGLVCTKSPKLSPPAQTLYDFVVYHWHAYDFTAAAEEKTRTRIHKK